MKKIAWALLVILFSVFGGCSTEKESTTKPLSLAAPAPPLLTADVIDAHLRLATTPVRIFAKHSGKVIHGHRNTGVEQQPYFEGNTDQYWKLVPTNTGWLIYQWHTSKCIRASGKDVILTNCVPYPRAEDFYDSSGERLDPLRSKRNYENAVGEFNSQFWNIEQVEQGFYVISSHWGNAIDIRGNSTDTGADAILWSKHKQDNQRFSFVSCEYFVTFAAATGTQWTDKEWSDLRNELCCVFGKNGGWKGIIAVEACKAVNIGVTKGVEWLIEASKSPELDDQHVKDWKERQKADAEKAIEKSLGGQGRPWENDGRYSDLDIMQSLRANGKG